MRSKREKGLWHAMNTQGSYYFWKWADNDLSGKPLEVFADLMRGEMHPALQTFDSRPLLKRLEKLGAEGRNCGEEWEWEENPPGSLVPARFVHLICPCVNRPVERLKRFCDEILPLGLSGYDEPSFHLIPCMRPKLNCFIFGQFSNESLYDITPEELPTLIRRIRPSETEPWGELLNRRHGAVCISKGRRFCVEWRENLDVKDPGRFEQWRAQDAKRLAGLNGADPSQKMPVNIDPDFLTYGDTLRIFEAFLRGEPRPKEYWWRKLEMGEL